MPKRKREKNKRRKRERQYIGKKEWNRKREKNKENKKYPCIVDFGLPRLKFLNGENCKQIKES